MTATEKPSLWAFALDTYSRPGVEQTCLRLQEECGVDVPTLLFSAWLGNWHTVALSGEDLTRIVRTVDPWHTEVVRPLRAVRRRLKAGPSPAPSPATDSMRNKLKAVELESERIQLAVLEEIAPSLSKKTGAPSPSELVPDNLGLVVAHYHGARPGPEIQQLIAGLADAIIGASSETSARGSAGQKP